MICIYLSSSDIISLRCTCQALCALLQEALWRDVDARCFRTLTCGRQTGASMDSFVRHTALLLCFAAYTPLGF